MKKLLAVAIAVIAISQLFFVVGCSNKITEGFVRAEDSQNGYASIYMPEDGNITILQLTDIHLEYFFGAKESIWHINGVAEDNASTVAMIDKMLTALKPDLIIITGDTVRTWTRDNFTEYTLLADVFEAKGIPWMPILGNHDFECGFEDYQHTSKQLIEALSNYPHCLATIGDCEDGFGNYFVNLLDKKQNIIYTFCALDCVAGEQYSNNDIYDSWSYVRTDAQIEWYERHIRAISALQYGQKSTKVVPSMVFIHTPVPEALTAWEEAWNDGNTTDAYHYGMLLSGKSTYRKYMGEDLHFSKAVELGSTKAMFFGHHHDNDFCVDYNGIRLTAGQMSTNNMDYRIGSTLTGIKYTAYDFTKLYTYGDNRGATEITINNSGDFTITPRYAREVCADYNEWASDFDAMRADLVKRGIEVTPSIND